MPEGVTVLSPSAGIMVNILVLRRVDVILNLYIMVQL